MELRSINAFAEAVHRLRRRRGMTLDDIAGQTTYSASYLSKILHGVRPLAPGLVREVDRALGADGELEQLAHEQDEIRRAPARPMQLPPAAADFVGRANYLHRLDAALIEHVRPGAAVTAVIEGGLWVGKTSLALHWAARVQNRFDGGCLFADLRGLAPGRAVDPGDVLDGFLHALGAGADALHGTIDERAARYRSLLAARPAIVVLDNIASYDQVRHLLPGAGSVVVLTSREHQPSLLLHSGGLHIDLPPLSPEEALTLLRRRAGDARVEVEREAAEAIVRRCGRLPMAVLIAAERIQQHPHDSLQSLADRLGSEKRRLDVFTSSDPTVNIHGVIDLSYLALAPLQQRVFRLAGIIPVPLLSAEAVAAQTGLDVGTVREVLDVLRHAHLLDDAYVGAGRLWMNHLLRAYAYQRAVVEDSLDEVARARYRLLRWYVTTAWKAGNALTPNWAGSGLTLDIEPDTTTTIPEVAAPFALGDYHGALAWCETEVITALEVARHARAIGAGDAAWMLPAFFLPYFYLTKNWSTWLTAATEGLAAAQALDSTPGIARCTQSLGWVLHELGRTEEGIDHLRRAVGLQIELNDDRGRAWSEFGLAAAYSALDRHDDAQASYELAETIFARVGLDLGVAVARAMLSGVHQNLGKTDDARALAEDALARALALAPKQPVASLAHHQLGLVLLQQHQPRAALTHFDAALVVRRIGHERWGQAETLVARGETLTKLGDPEGARASYRAAGEILESLQDPRALDIQAQIATINVCLSTRDEPGT
ncbi:transcriptional regulator [Amycolatopsis antarctica]|uniref:Transcriptional regulator n=1 Tax=Amycolatopsis antarctica TaxID=1854586 RepID=A0A263CX49_9PSEU|nr:XRE family transcriptional regulator [Amycolatopsis antarctica]OZM70724.1 transcriptional regulator [Amycolatopsis antarctica]